MYLYLAVTNDKYEFPVLIEDKASKLGSLLQMTEHAIQRSIRNGYNKRCNYRFYRIKIEENENEID